MGTRSATTAELRMRSQPCPLSRDHLPGKWRTVEMCLLRAATLAPHWQGSQSPAEPWLCPQERFSYKESTNNSA